MKTILENPLFWFFCKTNNPIYSPSLGNRICIWCKKEHGYKDHSLLQRATKKIVFWIWRNLSGGEAPFYASPELFRHKAPVSPSPADWRGLKLKLWNLAVDYLTKLGELTDTPALRERF